MEEIARIRISGKASIDDVIRRLIISLNNPDSQFEFLVGVNMGTPANRREISITERTGLGWGDHYQAVVEKLTEAGTDYAVIWADPYRTALRNAAHVVEIGARMADTA